MVLSASNPSTSADLSFPPTQSCAAHLGPDLNDAGACYDR